MRISDWSSDVCSSDLLDAQAGSALSNMRMSCRTLSRLPKHWAVASAPWGRWSHPRLCLTVLMATSRTAPCIVQALAVLAKAVPSPYDRKSVGEGKSVSVRVDMGGRRIIKNKKSSTELYN